MTAAQVVTIEGAAPGARPLSPSQVNTFLDCQARWYYGHVLNLPDPPTGSQALGRAVHRAAAVAIRAEVDGETISEADAGELARIAIGVELREAELREEEDAGALSSQAVDLAKLWRREIRPQLPAAAAVEIELHGRIGRTHAHGIADLVAEDLVVDLKTAKAKPGLVAAGYKLQLTTYAMLAGKRRARLITLARTKTPSWCQHTLEITPALEAHAAIVYDLAAGSMQSGLYIPNRGSNLCSRKHCAFWRECQRDYGGSID
jgi:hypothetical protein